MDYVHKYAPRSEHRHHPDDVQIGWRDVYKPSQHWYVRVKEFNDSPKPGDAGAGAGGAGKAFPNFDSKLLSKGLRGSDSGNSSIVAGWGVGASGLGLDANFSEEKKRLHDAVYQNFGGVGRPFGGNTAMRVMAVAEGYVKDAEEMMRPNDLLRGENERCVLVSNLPLEAPPSADEVRRAFAAYEVAHDGVHIVHEGPTFHNRFTGCAVVRFVSKEEAQRAEREMHTTYISAKFVHVTSLR
jgi:hypothetical protein